MEEEGALRPDIRAERLIILVVALIVLALWAALDLRQWERYLFDAYFVLRGPLKPLAAKKLGVKVTLIEIDPATDEKLAARWGRFPYPADLYSDLLSRLIWETPDMASEAHPYPPTRIVIDAPLLGRVRKGGEDAEAELAALLHREKGIWLASAVVASGPGTGGGGPPAHWARVASDPPITFPRRLPRRRISWLGPLPAFASAAPGGAMYLPMDADGRCRRLPLGISYNGAVYPELSYAVTRFLRPLPEETMSDGEQPPEALVKEEKRDQGGLPSLDHDHLMPINYAGPLRDRYGALLPPEKAAFPIYSLRTVMEMSPLAARQAFGMPSGNSYVLIGLALPGITERVPSPYDRAVHYPIETLAHAVRMHLANAYLRPVDPRVGWVMALLVVLLLGYVLPFTTAYRAGALTLATMAALLALDFYLFKVLNLLFPVLLPVLTAAIVYLAVMTHRLAREERRRRSLQRRFMEYLSIDLVLQLMDNPERISLEGEVREVTLMFADLREFTAFASTHSPLEVIQQLNEFLGEMSRVVEEYGGTVDKFIGDEVMAIFGAPIALEHPERNAVLAALEMQDRLDDMNRQWQLEGRQAFQMGVAVHTGGAVVGEIGAEVRRNYTAIGNTVNIAARLEELSKELGVRILATRATLEHVGGIVETREIGPMMLRGIAQPVIVYEVVARKGFYGQAGNDDG